MAHTGSQRSEVQPVFGRNVIVAVVFAVLTGGLLGVCLAQQEVNALSAPPTTLTKPTTPSDANAPKTFLVPAMPFMAEVTGNDVYVRSGPGTNYYHCGKLQRGDKVKVVKTQPGWSCIMPPPAFFSWIAMQYVAVSLDEPTVAFITGNGVWVYTGSDYVEPMHSTSKQVALNRGDKVRLLGEEKDDYYKIGPPDGAYVWVSSDFLEPIGPIGQKLGVDEGAAKIPAEEEKLKEFNDLKEKIKAEQAKPLAKRNYDEIKKALVEITKTPEAGKAAKYAELTLQQIAGFELAQQVDKEVEQQNARLQKITTGIDKAATARLADINDVGKYVVIGQLKASSIYDTGTGGVKYYRIIGKSGTTVCYAVPTGPAAQMDLSKLVGKKVGLVGTIKTHQATAGSMVEFTGIDEVK